MTPKTPFPIHPKPHSHTWTAMEIMDEDFELSERACDKLYHLILEKLANSNRVLVEDVSTDVEKHHTLRRAIIRTAYELGKTVAAIHDTEGVKE